MKGVNRICLLCRVSDGFVFHILALLRMMCSLLNGATKQIGRNQAHFSQLSRAAIQAVSLLQFKYFAVCVCARVRARVCLCIYACVCMCVCVCVCVCVSVFVSVCVCLYVCLSFCLSFFLSGLDSQSLKH